MTAVQPSGRRFSRVAVAAAVITVTVAAFGWVLASTISDSTLQLEGRVFGGAGHEKPSPVGSLHTRDQPARLSSNTVEVIAAPSTHFRTAIDLPTLTVELHRGTLLVRGEVHFVIGEATADGSGEFVLTTEPGQAVEQLNASMKALTNAKPVYATVVSSGGPQTLFVSSGHLDVRTAQQTTETLTGGQTWPRP